MADIQFRFVNLYGQPFIDVNGDFERGTLNGTIDGWQEWQNSGGTTGTYQQINNPVFWNNRSLRYVRQVAGAVDGSYTLRWNTNIALTTGTYRLLGWVRSDDSNTKKIAVGIKDAVTTTEYIKYDLPNNAGTIWRGFLTGSYVVSSLTAVHPFIGYGNTGGIAGGTNYLDRLGLYKQGRGTIDYTLDLQDMPTYPYAPQTPIKQLVKESYYGRSWLYPIFKKRQWIMNFQEVSETCKNNFEGLIWQGDDIFFFDNIQNVDGTEGGTFIVRIDPDSFKPETPYFNVWNFQIILTEVEGAGF